METFFPPIDVPSPTLNTNPTPTSDPLDTNPTPNPSPEPIELKSPKKEKDNDDLLNTKKKPTRTSDVWDHFLKIKGGNPNDPRCKCKYCGMDYACHSTRVGTSSLWGHLKKCKKYPNNVADKKQKVLSFKRGIDGEGSLLVATFNKVRCRNALAKFVVKDEQAFNVVEGAGFKDFINELQPRFVVPSRMTVTRDIYTLFCNERLKLRKELTVDGQKVESVLHRLYACYNIGVDGVSTKDGTCNSASKTINKEKRQRRLLENYMQQQQLETTEKKNDVDIYLAEEPLNPMIAQFDILLWWKDNASRYKTLSMIAKDILAIPVSTVASESAFSTSGRILDPFRSSLSPKMLEALVCTQSWLKGRHDGIKSDTYLDETYSYEFLEHEEGNPGIMKECAEPSGKTINIDD
ncbi:hypothetical protein POM88_002315 [Heracleum sosnowskyi]|uniref:BED-type domain-containing protein n=1 Tax=Heracleum sosnowskyi TaxID=360622 RepID=A0AAD8JDT9_9APIA|nr:hypothetical protein POM88_002315 [Heracleum sosnowskyi]